MREDFEIKRALDTYFREQRQLQERIISLLVSSDKQQRAMLAIFAAAAQDLGGKK